MNKWNSLSFPLFLKSTNKINKLKNAPKSDNLDEIDNLLKILSNLIQEEIDNLHYPLTIEKIEFR